MTGQHVVRWMLKHVVVSPVEDLDECDLTKTHPMWSIAPIFVIVSEQSDVSEPVLRIQSITCVNCSDNRWLLDIILYILSRRNVA